MKKRNRAGRATRRPAGFKLYRKVLKHKYGHQWREYVKLG